VSWVDLCVVGCGPTGIAALFEASRLGLKAIGLEAGAVPMASIEAHPDGLVYLSPPEHFEVGGLPLDCRDGTECNREDVLSYYARIVNYGRLTILRNHRCLALVPIRGGVSVFARTLRGQTEFRARDVIFTSWHRRRAQRGSTQKSNVRVLFSFATPLRLAGQRVVIYGGGLSGYEYATLLMMSGQRIVLVMRGALRGYHERRAFQRLLDATSSAVIPFARGVDVARDGVVIHSDARPRRISCDVLICAIGTEIDPASLRVLSRAGVISRSTARALRDAIDVDEGFRRGTGADEPGGVPGFVARSRPDLWHELFDGVRRIRLAGGPLHVGAANSGVFLSISTGVLASRSVAGVPAGRDVLQPPLAHALYFGPIQRLRKGWECPRVVDAIGLLRQSSWSRAWLGSGLAERNRQGGVSTFMPTGHTKYSSEPDLTEYEHDVLRRVGGSCTVRELAARLGVTDEASRESMLGMLRRLWTRNALSWIPPHGGLPRDVGPSSDAEGRACP
jgi:thioredoxin reductase